MRTRPIAVAICFISICLFTAIYPLVFPHNSQHRLVVNDRGYSLEINNISNRYAALNDQLSITEHYQGSISGMENSWLRLSRIGNTLYGLAGIEQKTFYIKQAITGDNLPVHIVANEYHSNQAGGPPVSLEGDTASMQDMPISALQLNKPGKPIDNLQLLAANGENPPRILNVEFIFDPGIIMLRGYDEVEKVLAAANLLSGYYESQANLIMNLSALHFPTITNNPITGTGQAFEIITDMASDRISGDLDIADDSIALYITSRPIMSQAGPHNGFAMLNAACTTSGNTVISDRVIFGAVGGPPIPNAPLDFLYLVEIFAHEIGHILGGSHTSCGGEGGIMSTFFDSTPRNHFSSCSINQFEAYLNTAGGCVLDYQTVVAGFDGTWFDLEHDGEGLQIQVLSSDRALVAWYSYDENGNQRWFSGIGVIQGNRIVIEQLTIASGAQFGENFDPDSVVRETWGSAIITFNNCSNGLLTYAELATGITGVQKLSRLTTLNALPCGDVAVQVATDGFDASGTWFDPLHDGEGLIVEQLNETTLVFSWFSYDSVGNQAWFTGIAVLQEDGSYLAESVSITNGGMFGPEFDPDQVQRTAWGSLRLSFIDCDNATLEYESLLPVYGSGLQNLTRLSTPSGISCHISEFANE